MARSKYIYVVFDEAEKEIISLHTVKWEAFDFIDRHLDYKHIQYKVLRTVDNDLYKPINISGNTVE